MGIAMITIAISSCTEDTTMLGNTLVSESDQFTIVSDTFDVSTRSIIADSILARSSYSYLGKIKDPETGSYITANFMTQFSTLESEASDLFPPLSVLRGEEDDHADNALVDSCFLNIIVDNFMGDSLAAMKMTVCELDKPVKENRQYYTNYDLEKNGFLRAGGIRKNTLYSLSDLTQSDSLRQLNQSGSNFFRISISLNEPYTDKNGVTYNNYGSYLMRTYYDHPEYFKNSQTFIQKVCPGFYFKTTDGLGLMTEIVDTRLITYYRIMKDGKETNFKTEFHGTEEVLQTTRITNNKMVIDALAANDEWTYLKTPAGIFTEVTLPVDDIKKGHENDTITSAKVVFHKMNDKSELTDKLLKDPTNLLMVHRDSLESFFDNHNIPNNTSSYLATLSTKYNSYTYTNISGIINLMYNNKEKGGANYTTEHPNWNKVVLVPVKTTMTSTSSGGTISAVNHEMSITSTRLIGGAKNQHEPIKISIIYNKTH